MQKNTVGVSKSAKSLAASNEVFPHAIDHYRRAVEAKRTGRAPLVYHSGFDPVEIDYALGAIPMFPGNFPAACGSTQLAAALMEADESLGAPQDLCLFPRWDWGCSRARVGSSV